MHVDFTIDLKEGQCSSTHLLNGLQKVATVLEVQEQLRTEGDVTCALPCFKGTLAARARAIKDRAISKATQYAGAKHDGAPLLSELHLSAAIRLVST